MEVLINTSPKKNRMPDICFLLAHAGNVHRRRYYLAMQHSVSGQTVFEGALRNAVHAAAENTSTLATMTGVALIITP
jgi:hypothetical protein